MGLSSRIPLEKNFMHRQRLKCMICDIHSKQGVDASVVASVWVVNVYTALSTNLGDG